VEGDPAPAQQDHLRQICHYGQQQECAEIGPAAIELLDQQILSCARESFAGISKKCAPAGTSASAVKITDRNWTAFSPSGFKPIGSASRLLPPEMDDTRLADSTVAAEIGFAEP